MNKRIKLFFTVSLLLVGALTARTGYLQLAKGQELSEQAAAQRFAQVLETENRGDITDRHFCALTHAGETPVAIVTPDLTEDGATLYRALQPYCSLSAEDFLQKLAAGRMFSVPLTREPDLPPLPGLAIASVSKRYGSESVGEHFLGYCSHGAGAAGLEAAFDPVLKEGSGQKAGRETDAAGRTMSDLTLEQNPARQRNLRLTVDARLQNIVETAGRSYLHCGAAVLLDVRTFDILAMASFPGFDPSDIAVGLSSPDGAMVNRALCAYDAGSVFKIVVTAAALEEGVDLGRYCCTGSVPVGDTTVSCYNRIAHGEESLPEAFAKSCNCYFIRLGEELGADKILTMAERFGIGEPHKLYENSGEQTDTAGERGTYYPGELANLSIGQGSVALTPLRGAELAAVVASGGMRTRVNLTESITDGNQKTVQPLSTHERERILSRDTAAMLQAMMYTTTATGTARQLELDSLGGAGCKTGTAQTGWGEGEQNKVHSWITGFFPADHPRYALCVFSENGANEDRPAAPVFAEIARQLLTDFAR